MNPIKINQALNHSIIQSVNQSVIGVCIAAWMFACTTASSDHKTPAKEPEIQQVVVSTVQSLHPSKRVTLPG